MRIIGHQKVIDLLDKAIVKNSVSHAYLFCGPENIGKFTAALYFAEKLAGADGKMNGNIIIIAPEIEEKKGILKKHDIKIEKIRDLQHQLSLSAQGKKYKVAIIDEAEKLNKAAQNSLLKTLEEAEEKIVLILVAQNEKKILPTVFSRCQKIKFKTVSDNELKKHIIVTKNINDIIFWSLGRPGLMLELQKNEKALEFRQESIEELQKLHSQNVVEKFAVAEEMAKNVEVALKKMDLWLIFLREIILGQKNNSAISAKKALRIMDDIMHVTRLLRSTNSSARLVLENLFLKF